MSHSVFTTAIFLLGWAGLASGIFAQNPNYAIIPFKLAGKFIYVEASADGRTGNFIIDTGCAGIVLNSQYFEGIEENRLIYDINGPAKAVGGRYAGLSLGTLDFPVSYAVVASLDNVEEQMPGTPVMGLIGGGLFMDYELAFDFANGELTLCRLDKNGRKRGLALPHSAPTDTFSIVLKGHLPCIEVQVGTAAFRFAIDSGAEVNVLDHKSLKKAASCLKAQREVHLTGLGRQPEPVMLGMLTGMELGGTAYLPMQTIVKDIEHFNHHLPGPQLDGILGFHFLRQYKTAINLKKKELYIWNEDKRESEPSEKELMVKY